MDCQWRGRTRSSFCPRPRSRPLDLPTPPPGPGSLWRGRWRKRQCSSRSEPPSLLLKRLVIEPKARSPTRARSPCPRTVPRPNAPSERTADGGVERGRVFAHALAHALAHSIRRPPPAAHETSSPRHRRPPVPDRPALRRRTALSRRLNGLPVEGSNVVELSLTPMPTPTPTRSADPLRQPTKCRAHGTAAQPCQVALPSDGASPERTV
jgi:hypothetical protein